MTLDSGVRGWVGRELSDLSFVALGREDREVKTPKYYVKKFILYVMLLNIKSNYKNSLTEFGSLFPPKLILLSTLL